jgi:predicted ribosomally synthesized peptide with nif11-like leader
MNKDKIKQIYELTQNNEEVRAQLENTEQVEEIVSIINQNGIDVSVEEISNAISSVEAGECGELDETMLEGVAGGYCSKGRNWKCFGHFMWNYAKGIWSELSK